LHIYLFPNMTIVFALYFFLFFFLFFLFYFYCISVFRYTYTSYKLAIPWSIIPN
jgi:hypothetical protein